MALEQLGFEPCHHMYDVVESPSQIDLRYRIAVGETPEWDKVFEGFRPSVAWPSIAYWREISAAHPDAACPDAKVLLTRRPVDAWFKSFSKTILPLLHQRDKDVGRGDHPEGGDDPANHP